NDQSDADIYAAQSLSLIGVFAGYATGRILLRAQGDAKIAGGIVAALPSGGTSLLASLWGLIDKVVIGMALDFAYEKTRNYAIQSIRNNIATLECYKECPKCGKNPCICKTPPPPLEPVSPIHDPSGYVYEGVSSNRVEGVMASCYYKETVEDMYGDLHENVVLWDAEQYAQENPLFTDENGMYRWDVPQGLWQVKFEKEGYETTYSDWLPVPPPQLEVNIPMKQNVQPNVKSARAFENTVEVQFDKYMIPELLTTENIMVLADENVVEGTIELLDEEISYEGKTDKYASKIRFNAKEPFSAEEVTLIVKNRVKSYAGIRMQDDYSQNFIVELEVRKIECDSVLSVIYGEQSTITVQVHPASAAAGKTLKVKSLAPLLLSVDKNAVTLDAGGKAEIMISGDLPGTAALMFEVDGYDISATSIVKIGNMESLMVATPTTSIASGSEVAVGTEIYLSCATENATIYYTLDGTCPCENTSSVIRYDGTPIVINETTTIKAIAYAEGMYESEVATFVYTVNNGSGIDEEKTGKYTVYPQLVKDIVNIDIPDDVSANVCIASVHGQTVYERKNMTGHNTVDMTGLTKGMYVVAIRDGNELVSIKIIKIGN
ncbi:MAG: chitobiase/beta-hexosaminidase C-terminal domain-containing protein, partial [Bacteroidaceae bacterium]|nr:chitobiase/beta-hexosaminidase C-terminal domain-containing protein [Bacteroidaceae bacterium]